MTKALDFRRRREAKTDYNKRLSIIKGNLDKIVIRKTNRRIIGEVIRYGEGGDQVIAYVDSGLLASKYNWPSRSNRATAYLTGLMLAKTVKEKKLDKNTEYVLDIGLSSPVKNSIPFVFAKGCIDGGLKLRSGIEIKEEIYNYSNTEYAKKVMQEGKSKEFGKFVKDGVKVEELGKRFEEMKKKITSE